MGAPIEGSPPDLSAQITTLLDRAISPAQFWRWFGRAQASIELYGSDDDNDLANTVENVYAEYTSGYITTEELLESIGLEVGRDVAPVSVGQRVVA